MKEKTIYKQIRLLYFAILIGLLIFLAISYVFVLKNGAVSVVSVSFGNSMQSLIVILILAGIPASYMFHTKKTSHINPDLSLVEKLVHYRRSLFIKFATLESLSLISLLAYIMTNSRSYLFFYFILVIVFAINYPGKNKIKQELNLEDQSLNF